MRQAPRSPLSFKLQRVANVSDHPPPSTRLMSCAHIANRRLSRIIGARKLAAFPHIAPSNHTGGFVLTLSTRDRPRPIRALAFPDNFVSGAMDSNLRSGGRA